MVFIRYVDNKGELQGQWVDDIHVYAEEPGSNMPQPAALDKVYAETSDPNDWAEHLQRTLNVAGYDAGRTGGFEILKRWFAKAIMRGYVDGQKSARRSTSSTSFTGIDKPSKNPAYAYSTHFDIVQQLSRKLDHWFTSHNIRLGGEGIVGKLVKALAWADARNNQITATLKNVNAYLGLTDADDRWMDLESAVTALQESRDGAFQRIKLLELDVQRMQSLPAVKLANEKTYYGVIQELHRMLNPWLQSHNVTTDGIPIHQKVQRVFDLYTELRDDSVREINRLQAELTSLRNDYDGLAGSYRECMVTNKQLEQEVKSNSQSVTKLAASMLEAGFDVRLTGSHLEDLANLHTILLLAYTSSVEQLKTCILRVQTVRDSLNQLAQ